MKTKWYLISGLILVFVSALIYERYQQKSFEVARPFTGNITEAVYGLGKVKSAKRFEVIVGVMSTVTRRFVNEGDSVKKGDPLVEMGEGTLFKAPFNGTVTLALLYEGETAVPGVPHFRVEDLKNRYIEVSLEQQASLRIKPGLIAKVSLESLRGNTLNGIVQTIFPRENEFLTRIAVDGLDDSVLPGMSADVSIEIGKIENAVLVPLRAVQNGMITVKRNGRWEKIKVEVSHVDGLNAEIKNSNLTPQDEIRIKSGE